MSRWARPAQALLATGAGRDSTSQPLEGISAASAPAQQLRRASRLLDRSRVLTVQFTRWCKGRAMATRDPEATKQRILAAALHEFSAKGIAGARVDAIAQRAKVN